MVSIKTFWRNWKLPVVSLSRRCLYCSTMKSWASLLIWIKRRHSYHTCIWCQYKPSPKQTLLSIRLSSWHTVMFSTAAVLFLYFTTVYSLQYSVFMHSPSIWALAINTVNETIIGQLQRKTWMYRPMDKGLYLTHTHKSTRILSHRVRLRWIMINLCWKRLLGGAS